LPRGLIPFRLILCVLAATLGGCSITAQPDNVPVVGPAVSDLLHRFSPIQNLDLAGLIQVDFRANTTTGEAEASN
jgi:hypothetical protein